MKLVRWLARVWGPAAFCVVGSLFLLVGGPAGDDRRSEPIALQSAPALASMTVKTDLFSRVETSVVEHVRIDDAASSLRLDKPFPVLPFAAGMLLVLALWLHLAAWRLAR